MLSGKSQHTCSATYTLTLRRTNDILVDGVEDTVGIQCGHLNQLLIFPVGSCLKDKHKRYQSKSHIVLCSLHITLMMRSLNQGLQICSSDCVYTLFGAEGA